MTLKENQLKLARKFRAAHDRFMKDSKEIMPDNLHDYMIEYFTPLAAYMATMTLSVHDLACRASAEELDLSVTIDYFQRIYQEMLEVISMANLKAKDNQVSQK